VEEIVTGEAVVLDLPYARFPTRMLAHGIDMIVQIVIFGVILLVGFLAVPGPDQNTANGAALLVSALVVSLVGYPVVFETLSRGRTLGKLAMGLRVVSDDGGPIRFRQALVRGLAGVIECWGMGGFPALITSMLSARGKRLGDIFSGTFVLRERAPRQPAVNHAAIPYPAPAAPGYGTPAGYGTPPGYGAPPGYGTPAGYAAPAPGYSAAGYGVGTGRHSAVLPVEPALQAWARTIDLTGVPDQLAASAGNYLSRYWQLDKRVRDQLGWQLASDIRARVSPPPPPGLPPVAYLNAVLTERRNRELARLQAQNAAAAASSAWQARAAAPGWQSASPAGGGVPGWQSGSPAGAASPGWPAQASPPPQQPPVMPSSGEPQTPQQPFVSQPPVESPEVLEDSVPDAGFTPPS
jgi:uncharacterized RDD family membrane protein YckC